MWKLFANKTYKRLYRIYQYCEEFYSNTFKNGFGTIEFKSNLGDVRIEIIKGYNSLEDIYLSYANYAGSTVFTITAYTTTFDVSPLLNDELTGHDVDLALYELEEYLYSTYGDINKILSDKEKDYKEKLKRHRQELKILEEGC